ncbi:MAG: bifunctional oligoribonuclease/PAP phosphatase NrnA [Chthoniobacteraceae bacterium]
MKTNCSLAEIAGALKSHQTFVIMSHVRPDGDALGCEIAMALSLKEMGKTVTVWNQDGMLEKYSFLPCSGLVIKPPAAPEDFDVAISLDTAVEDRVGTCLKALGNIKLRINIDHHVSNNHYGDLAYIDTASPATGQILHELIKDQNLPFNVDIAENLFVAISTDTGSFQYPNTTARTFEIGAELVKAGVNVGRLSQQIYESYPRRRIDLLRALLNVLKISCNDRVASFTLSLETAKALGAQPEDNEGLIDTIRAIEGIVVAAFIEELPGNHVRISLRSKDPRADVCKVCAQFGGGGHTLAAGARIQGSLEEVEKKVLAAICNEITY